MNSEIDANPRKEYRRRLAVAALTACGEHVFTAVTPEKRDALARRVWQVVDAVMEHEWAPAEPAGEPASE